MNKYNDEYIGSGPILPIEIIDLININKSGNDQQSPAKKAGAVDDTPLDEYEIAMVA